MKVERQATEELDRLAGLIESIKVGMLTTIGPDGSLRSRPLQTLEMDAQGRLWFFAEAQSPKTEEMEAHDHQVCLSYADSGRMSYVSVSGTGRLVRERERMRELWTPLLKAWFPRGLDDPSLGLLEVRLDKAEFWDSPGSATLRMSGRVDNVKTAGPRTAAPGDEAKAPKP
ncbi:MAG TPA: pyridoxamine 5'-phosphate oxidase family protein [Burkholderiales bacterium]|nr:pyridoxamine 5'-phosphate oxidase family protein [Burkholderiales bacterium]